MMMMAQVGRKGAYYSLKNFLSDFDATLVKKLMCVCVSDFSFEIHSSFYIKAVDFEEFLLVFPLLKKPSICIPLARDGMVDHN